MHTPISIDELKQRHAAMQQSKEDSDKRLADDEWNRMSIRKRQQLAIQRIRLGEFLNLMGKIFPDELPVFVPTSVNVGGEGSPRVPKMPWKPLFRNMQGEQLVVWMHKMEEAVCGGGCVQVRMGNLSGNLCSLDVDHDDLVQPLLQANPVLSTTLQTRGSKGRTFWFYAEGEYPQKKQRIFRGEQSEKNPYKIEFLTEGNLCTIWGVHYKNGQQYQMVHKATPITFKLDDLKLPSGCAWEVKIASNGHGKGKTFTGVFRAFRTNGTADASGRIDWKAYDAARETEPEIVEFLVGEYFDADRQEKSDGSYTWRCGNICGDPAHDGKLGSFEIDSIGRCTEWASETHCSIMQAITSEEREERYTYQDAFTYLAEQGYNFFMSGPEKLPQVLLPYLGKNESALAKDIADNLPEATLFNKDGFIVELETDDDLGQGDGLVVEPYGITTRKFSVMRSMRFATWVEQYMDTGVMVQVDKDTMEFKAKTMNDLMAGRVLAGVTLSRTLSRITRILDVIIPFRTTAGDIIYPQAGYNKDLRLYCDPRAPKVKELPHKEALKVILQDVYGEFCFKDEQSRTHAVARLVTPYMRGIMGFDARMPLWWFEGNRPGTGKDYCNGVSQLLYLGRAFEDAPVGESSEETRKRITTALVAGRRMMYFANCQHHLSDPNLLTAITDHTFRTRMLGATSAESDLELTNEMEFALSANVGITYKEDYERRMRKIVLEFYAQDINARKFTRPNLWAWVLKNRGLVLSAIHTLFLHWVKAGMPKGESPFTSFPVWAEEVGGLLMANGLGDPCLPQADDHFGGDLRTRAMTALYETVYQANQDNWATKDQICMFISAAQHGGMGIDGDDRLDWFGDLMDGPKKQENRVRLGLALKSFNGRELSDLKMEIDTTQLKTARQKIKFYPV